MPCSYCGIGGHGVDKCPNRLEEKFGTGDNFDADDDDIRTDGGRILLKCPDCGRTVNRSVNVRCPDPNCGHNFVPGGDLNER